MSLPPTCSVCTRDCPGGLVCGDCDGTAERDAEIDRLRLSLGEAIAEATRLRTADAALRTLLARALVVVDRWDASTTESGRSALGDDIRAAIKEGG